MANNKNTNQTDGEVATRATENANDLQINVNTSVAVVNMINVNCSLDFNSYAYNVQRVNRFITVFRVRAVFLRIIRLASLAKNCR